MNTWEIILLVVAVLVAVRSLTTMMRARRDQLISEVQKQVDEHNERLKKQKRKEQQQSGAA